MHAGFFMGEGGILPGENEPTEFCQQNLCVASRARSIRPMTAESVDGGARGGAGLKPLSLRSARRARRARR